MTVFFIILGALVAVGLPLYLLHRYDERHAPKDLKVSKDSTDSKDPTGLIDDEVCCGMHLTCDKDSLLAAVSETIEYFDDEELDRFAGRSADSYTPDEIEEFRDVLLTLLPADIAPWARSIQLRGITLPSDVRDELMMIVAEARAARG
ncbi:MAG: phospholipase [Muribaculaceae bacterium]|nr:phospholipase [Muribaculaceae bacterium]